MKFKKTLIAAMMVASASSVFAEPETYCFGTKPAVGESLAFILHPQETINGHSFFQMTGTIWDNTNHVAMVTGMASWIGDHWEAKLYGRDTSDHNDQRLFITLVLRPDANVIEYGDVMNNSQSIGTMTIDMFNIDDVIGWSFQGKKVRIWNIMCQYP